MRFVILHYHIFKNAGSTVEDILDHSFGDRFGSLETPVGGGLISNPDLVRYLDAHPAVRAFSSHQIRYPMPQAPGYLFFDICFLRDPLDRLRSFYDYFRQKPNAADPMSDLANRSSLGYFAAGMIRDHSLFIRNNQVNLLACGGDSDEPDERDLDVAVRRVMSASFLGVVDCFEQSAVAGRDALRCVFPELDCARPAVNVSRGMQGTVASRIAELKEACRPDVYEELLRITELDRRLVELARAEVLRRSERVRARAARHSACAATGRPLPRGRGSVGRILRLAPYWRELPDYRALLADLLLGGRPLFDAEFYLRKYPDVRQAGLNPLIHYLRNGAAEDRKPHPLFEPAYYRASCGQPLPAGQNPFAHFLNCGADAANPHPLFDCVAYLEAHPEVAGRDLNPLVHYVNSGTVSAEPGGAAVDILDVRLVLNAAEPQQLPFLRAVSMDQIRAQRS